MTLRYQITLFSQLGPREGLLLLRRETDGAVGGSLFLAGQENRLRGWWDGGMVLTLTHGLRTALGEHLCRSVFRLTGDELSGTAELDGCKMVWSGQRLPETEEGERE